MELKKNNQRSAEEKDRLARLAISLMTEKDDEVMTMFYSSHKPNDPHWKDTRIDFTETNYNSTDVFVPEDVCECVVAKFLDAGYWVWKNEDPKSDRLLYKVTRHDIKPFFVPANAVKC